MTDDLMDRLIAEQDAASQQKLHSEARWYAVGDAFNKMLGLTRAERAAVMAWFCGACWKHLPQGVVCDCRGDE